MRKVFAFLSLLGLAGCVYPDVAQRQAYLQQFVGAPEADLVRTLGVPTRTIDADGHHFLAYSEDRSEVIPAYGFGGYWGGYGQYYGPPVFGGATTVIHRACETTFELNAGRVTGFSLRGNACG